MPNHAIRVIAAAAFWLLVLLLLWADWRSSQPHDRWAEPLPLALGSGPAADAGHCSLAPPAKPAR